MNPNYNTNKSNYRPQHNKYNNNYNNQRQITNNNDSLTITRNFNSSYNNHNNNNKSSQYNKKRNWDQNRNQAQGTVKKTIPGNMRERKEIPMSQQVKLALQIITKLGDFSQSSDSSQTTGVIDENDSIDNNSNHITEELLSNIKTTAEIFITVGDLDEYPHEIASLFVQCFSQLSVQIPIIATLLALLHTDKPEFTQLVITKLQERLMQAIAEDDVMSAKLILKSIACLASCGTQCFKINGTGGLVHIIETLIHVINFDLKNAKQSSSAALTPTGQAVSYLLASTLIWSANTLYIQQQKAVLDSAREVLQQIKSSWRSPYAKENLQAVFINTVSFPNTEEEDEEVTTTTYGSSGKDRQSISVGPSLQQQSMDSNSNDSDDQSCWDTLWESCNTALSVLANIEEHNSHSAGGEFTYPSCMNAVWTPATGLIPTESAVMATASASVILSLDATFAESFIALHTQTSSTNNGFLGRSSIYCIPSKTCNYVIGSSYASTWLRARFTIFDSESSADAAICCKELNILEKYQAFNYFQDILHFFDPIINEDGTKLGSMELLTSHLLAVFKLYPKHIHLEYVLIEMLLQIIVQQPVNSTLNASVYRLILELCRKSPQVFPPVVALGANILFQIVADMDYSASIEFAKWFSFHLINTKLSWPYWDFWVQEYEELSSVAGDSNSDSDNTSSCILQLFIRFVAEKCHAAVVVDKVKAAFPDIFHNFIPNDQQSVYCALLTTTTSDDAITNNETTATTSGDLLMKGIEGSGGGDHHSIIPLLTIALNEQSLSLKEVAVQLEILIDAKTSSDEIISWIDKLSIAHNNDIGTNTSTTEDIQATTKYSSSFCWKGCLLMQVLLHKGTAARGTTNQLSALIGLLDRYSDAIRNFSVSEENQLDVLAILQEVFRYNSYMYHYCLNEMLRRGQLSVVAVARALCGDMQTSSPYYTATHFSVSLNNLNSDPTVYQCLESLVDRTLDFVNASIAQRKLLGGDMLLDESLDLTATTVDMDHILSVRKVLGKDNNKPHLLNNNNNDDDDNNNNDDDDDGNRHKRARRDSNDETTAADTVIDTNNNTTLQQHKEDNITTTFTTTNDNDDDVAAMNDSSIDMMDNDDEIIDDPIWASEEAVKSALRNSRVVYGIIISSLVRGILTTVNNNNTTTTITISSPIESTWNKVACSLIRRTIRVYHGLQQHLTQQYQQRVVITEPHNILLQYLEQLPANIATTTWSCHSL